MRKTAITTIIAVFVLLLGIVYITSLNQTRKSDLQKPKRVEQVLEDNVLPKSDENNLSKTSESTNSDQAPKEDLSTQ